MCKAVKHSQRRLLLSSGQTFNQSLHRKPVVFLVKEESCLLSICYIDLIMHAILHNLNNRIKLRTETSFIWSKSFLLAQLRVTALVYGADFDTILRHDLFQ